METPQKIPHISGNENPEKLLTFREMEHFSPSSKNNKNPPCEKFLIFQEMELSDSKIKLEKIHSKKISYILILKNF